MKSLTICSTLTMILLLAATQAVLAQDSLPQPGHTPSVIRNPLGTGFTYQGYLEDGSGPFSGAVDFTFSLWDDPTATNPGNQIGAAVEVGAVQVDNGLFTAELDFGSGAFGSGARYLEIAVNGTTLNPRQPLSPAPYALALPGLYTDERVAFVGVGRDTQIESQEFFGVEAPVTGIEAAMATQLTDPEGNILPGQDGKKPADEPDKAED